MVFIIKETNKKNYKIVKLSALGYGPPCRLIDLTNESNCFDKSVNRVQFYRFIINKMIEDGLDIRPFKMEEVPNTLHDRIVRFFLAAKTSIYMVEVDAEIFPF